MEQVFDELNLKHIDFLKMDCEGAEYGILENLPNAIFDRITTISMEFHDLKDKMFTVENLISRLKSNKFEIVKFHYGKSSMNLNYGKLIGTKLFINKGED